MDKAYDRRNRQKDIRKKKTKNKTRTLVWRKQILSITINDFYFVLKVIAYYNLLIITLIPYIFYSISSD